MEDKEFEKLVEDALEKLPKEFVDKLENVNVVVADWPTRAQGGEQVKRGEYGLLLGLYEGIPRTRRGSYGIGGALPDKITIFKLPILMISKTEADIKVNVERTVAHEIAHHFGMSDEHIYKVHGRN